MTVHEAQLLMMELSWRLRTYCKDLYSEVPQLNIRYGVLVDCFDAAVSAVDELEAVQEELRELQEDGSVWFGEGEDGETIT
jgi:hypothetical protein